MKTRRLYCRLTDEELILKGADLTREMEECRTLEGEFELSRKSFKTRIEEKETIVQRLATTVRQRKEERDVEITEDKDYDKKQRIVTRLDTGEIVDVYAMTPQELQRPIPFNPLAAKDESTPEEKKKRRKKDEEEKVAVGE